MKPEEKVRVRLLKHLIENLNYPKELITVEKELALLPDNGKAPKRRLDALVYVKKDGELKPLLIIECKAAGVTESALQQALGYNHTVRAPFIAVVGKNEAVTVSKDGKVMGGLLSYDKLIAAI